MQIQKINQVSFSSSETPQSKKYSPVKITGYTSLGLGIASIAAASNKKIKFHRTLGWSAGILALVHTGLVEWRHYQKNKK